VGIFGGNFWREFFGGNFCIFNKAVFMPSRRVYSIQTRQKAIQAFNDLQNSGRAFINGQQITSISRFVQLLDIKRESTLRHWVKIQDWSKEAIKSRLHNRGRKSELEPEEIEDLKRFVYIILINLLSFIIVKWENHEACTAVDILSFVKEEFD
jgi:hypothetical protein